MKKILHTLLTLIFGAAIPLVSFADMDTSPANLPEQSSLPNPLVAMDGTRITTAQAWHDKRAPELRELFQRYEYGQRPRDIAITAKVLREDKTALGGKATLREIIVDTTLAANPVHLLLVIPNKQSQPAACFLGMCFTPNYTLLPDPQIQRPENWAEEKRGSQATAWPIEQIIDRGYAIACFFNGDIMTDAEAPAKEALKRFAAAANVSPDAGDAPGTIMAWAWSFSRMLDYLQTVPELDHKRIAVVGHSRNGKATLIAAALDERFALVIPTQAGCGGTAPCRIAPKDAFHPDGKAKAESVAAITTRFPHWFCKNFATLGPTPQKLPFDQHELIALCAPRPVLISCATEDLWSNPAGQFAMARAASPVYQLVVGEGLQSGITTMPKVGHLVDSRIGYFIRSGRHSMTVEDWTAWLAYSDKWLK